MQTFCLQPKQIHLGKINTLASISEAIERGREKERENICQKIEHSFRKRRVKAPVIVFHRTKQKVMAVDNPNHGSVAHCLCLHIPKVIPMRINDRWISTYLISIWLFSSFSLASKKYGCVREMTSSLQSKNTKQQHLIISCPYSTSNRWN